MQGDDLELDDMCKKLLKASQGVVAWKWDERFDTVLAEFDVTDKNKVRTILDQFFLMTWDPSILERAPLCVQELSRNLGGLRTGQLLFTTDVVRSFLLYCAWWPWGDGKTISIRIAPYYKDLPKLEKAEKIKKFKMLFKL